jgi:hypothetical protein
MSGLFFNLEFKKRQSCHCVKREWFHIGEVRQYWTTQILCRNWCKYMEDAKFIPYEINSLMNQEQIAIFSFCTVCILSSQIA